MSKDGAETEKLEALLATPALAEALGNERFRHFLDQMPIAIIVSELEEEERIIYANPEFEKLSGQAASDVEGKPLSALHGKNAGEVPLGAAVAETSDCVGTFQIDRPHDEAVLVDAYANVIEDDLGTHVFRLVALVNVTAHAKQESEELEQAIRLKDAQLREIQHRVKNNLQMIAAVIRFEARTGAGSAAAVFDRLAGQIESLQLLYRLLSEGQGQEIDLGVYLSQIASAMMRSHASEGIRLDLKVDAYPVSVNVAMPAGLVVNELLTNSFKHAFRGRDRGTIILHSLTGSVGCQVVVADDGIGLPPGVVWPQPGKLSSLIVQSLRENAKADLEVQSDTGVGTRVTILFRRADATSQAAA